MTPGAHAVRRPPITSAVAREDVRATALQRYGALAIVAVLILGAMLAALFGRRAGPEVGPLVPITATMWSLADLLTALLLLAQFYASRRFLFCQLSFAYGFNGFITWAFVAYFPHLFSNREVTLGTEQISNLLWVVWHCTFPALLACAFLLDTKLERLSRRVTERLTRALIALAPLCAGLVTLTFASLRDALPHLIVHGTFEPAYRLAVLPSVLALNACTTLILLCGRTLTPLRLWLALATFAGCIDVALVGCGNVRYSYVWDAGKLLTVFTSAVVLIMMLWDLIGMYGRLERAERIDGLTSLSTRYVFEEHLSSLLKSARHRLESVALLVIVVDSFSRYAEEYGSASSDECLRRIARELLDCAGARPNLVARYGENEFVMLVPGASLAQTRKMAERIRTIVERLQIVLGRSAVSRVTVSIGIGFTSGLRTVRSQEFFDSADRALADAIRRGGNAVALPADAEDSLRELGDDAA